MMSSDISFFSYSRELLLYLKYILKLIFKGIFSINRCLIFKVRRTPFLWSARLYYQIHPHLSTPFFKVFRSSSQLRRVFHLYSILKAQDSVLSTVRHATYTINVILYLQVHFFAKRKSPHNEGFRESIISYPSLS